MAVKAQRFEIRQNMKNDSFELFHYRDENLPSVGLHHHDFYEVYFLIKGKVRYRVEGRTYELDPGDILLMNPQELHQAEVDKGDSYERLVLWINRSYLQSLGGDLDACFDIDRPGHVNLIKPDRMQRANLQEMLERIRKEVKSSAFGHDTYAKGLLMLFLVEINRLADNTENTVTKVDDEDDLLSRVLAYIGAHYQEKLTLDMLSNEFYVSKYYLSHEFTERVGTSVYRYVIFRRLMQAKEMMETGMQPGEVYQSCGFGDYANFFRAFKGEYGISPKDYYAEVNK